MVSIIVPVYNGEKTLDRCVNSILCQTYKNIELILVNDGSEDNTKNICDGYVLKDERVKVIHKKNGGVSSARNVGLKVAKGKYIQFVDSDDYIDLNMTETLVDSIVKNETQLAICGINYGENEASNSDEFPNVQFMLVKDMFRIVPNFVLNYFPNSVCNKLYIRDNISENFIESISLGEDLIFNFEYFKAITAVTIIPNRCVHYSIHNKDSLTGRVGSERVYDTLEVYKYSKKFYLEYGCKQNLLETEKLCKETIIYTMRDICIERKYADDYKDNIYDTVFNDKEIVQIFSDFKLLSFGQKIILFLLKNKMYRMLKLFTYTTGLINW